MIEFIKSEYFKDWAYFLAFIFNILTVLILVFICIQIKTKRKKK